MIKLKKIEKILFLVFIFSNILLICLVYHKEKENYNQALTAQIEEKRKLFELKTNLLYSSILDLKNDSTFLDYDLNPTPYNLLKVFKTLKIKNSFFSKFGYTISFGNNDSNTFITPEETTSKEIFFNNLGLSPNSLSNLEIKEKDSIIYLLNLPSKLEPLQKSLWLISIDKNIFFSDIKTDNIDNWKIKKNTLKNIEPYSFKNNSFDFNLIFYPNEKNILSFIILDILKILFLNIFIFICILKIFKFFQNPIIYINQRKNLKDYILGTKSLKEIESFTSKFENLSFPIRLVLIEVLDSDTSEFYADIFPPIKKYLIDSLSNSNNYEYVDIDYKSILFIVSKETLIDIDYGFSFLLENIEKKYKLKLTGSISNEILNIINIPREYIKCKRILNYKFLYSSCYILLESLTNKSIPSFFYSIEIENKFSNRLLNGNFLGCQKIIDEIFEDIDFNLDKNKVNEFSLLLSNTLNRVISQLKHLNPNNKIDVYLKETNLFNLKNSLLKNCKKICDLKEMEEKSNETEIKSKILQYLENNYSKDFSLEDLSDYLGFSFRYTSLLFKKNMGDNFKNYLNLFRVNKSKEIIQNDKTIKIKEVAELVGYNSSNTFIRIFKKYEGVSPAKFFLENLKD
ncbi:helix-turn-helix domain-containing protein [Cetobacterium somerae]|uniref:AraC family transcriptional regulator n=1 Tax=Cetobacterium sp. NK01 TaxID=2993530 RepID=UPI002117135A|nr:helix-turn-helix domain-containing protein [Cetobacterium sp. NK01]MCQ8211347.1 helix-turn-helix domain-containing protein [Cetobacterium sp. NK01]